LKILFYNSKNSETYENDTDDTALLIKENYNWLTLLVKVIIATIYSFGLGYSLYYYSENIIPNFLLSLEYLIIFYFLLEFIYAIFTSSLLPKAFNNNVTVNLRLFSSSNSSEENVSKKRLLISLLLPFFILSLLPLLFSFFYGFNPILYAFLYASTVKGSSYLIYSIIILTKDFGEEILVKENAYLNIKK